jgi:sugar phosphate permease
MLEDVVRMGRDPRLLLITAVCVVLFTAQVALMGFFPWTLVNVAHVSPGFASLVFVISQFAAAAGRLVWGWASDRLFHGGRLLPMAITCVLCAISALAVSRVGHMPVPVLAAVAVAIGFSAEGWFGLAIVAMAEVGGEEHAGSALGFGLTWAYAAGVVTPFLFARLMHTSGIPSAWNALALLCVAGVVPAAAAVLLHKRLQAAAVTP